ncbi:MAG: hypothetical protein JO259_09580, partial [Mycobacterium sp.]|nr:hypothetical protein [Mycobacterium sp.]
TKIDDGWGKYAHVLMFSDDGDDTVLFVVDDTGTMQARHYNHPNGWDTTQYGPTVPGDWSGFSRLIGTTSTVFGIKADGNLYWYKPLPAAGAWTMAPNSGNQIGLGFDGLDQLVVGGIDAFNEDDPSGSFFPTLMGINSSHQLQWYPYEGNGKGGDTADWGATSGAIISGSW